MGETPNAQRILVGNPEEKRPLGYSDVDERIPISELGCERVDMIHLTQGRVQWQAPVNSTMDLRLPQLVRNFTTSLTTTNLSRRICSMELVFSCFVSQYSSDRTYKRE
jgi:hypothetical protein